MADEEASVLTSRDVKTPFVLLGVRRRP